MLRRPAGERPSERSVRNDDTASELAVGSYLCELRIRSSDSAMPECYDFIESTSV